ncbi:MAG: transcription elongation factor GreA [Clostridia bacterium]|nr:transcription elongation factor GreA [Clostridia bacterium]
MAIETHKYTLDELNTLKDELEELKTVGRRKMSEKIKEALSYGDLSENAEYDAAKTEQGKMESRINELEYQIQNAILIDDADFSTDTVSRVSKIRIRDVDNDIEETYQIVSPTQADPLNGTLSDESPVGKALQGHSVGEVIDVETPGGVVRYEILEIGKRS